MSIILDNTANHFLNQWKSIYPNLFDYTLMGTTIDLSQFNAILNPINGNQNGYGLNLLDIVNSLTEQLF